MLMDSRSLYISDIVVRARRKRDIRITKLYNHPVILNDETFKIPVDILTWELRSLVKKTIDSKKFPEFTYEYEIINPKFSSKLYESSKFKKDP